jgi:folate-binding protein YgfZ
VLAGGHAARVARHDRTGLGGYDLVFAGADAEAVRERAQEVACSVGGDLMTEAVFDLLRLERGRSRFGMDFGPDTLPQEARLDSPREDALSFEKGCFLGQEVVARIRFRGHVNKHLVSLAFDGDAPGVVRGAAISKDGREVGQVTSIARPSSPGGGARPDERGARGGNQPRDECGAGPSSAREEDTKRQGAVALGYVRREHAIAGVEVTVAPGAACARVVERP